ncbi:MAG: glycosyltransferase family 4 protein [Hyphomicrobiales bacterium]|nr:glycosyltransferase family 4 protein [Hyphomicrobiales bacterium]
MLSGMERGAVSLFASRTFPAVPLFAADERCESTDGVSNKMMKGPLRILLWSPKGSSTSFYGGPPIASYRLYRQRQESEISVSLAHGARLQPPHPEVFDTQTLIYPLRHPNNARNGVMSGANVFASLIDTVPGGPATEEVVRKIQFVRHAGAWLRQNVQRFDVFHGMGVHTTTLDPAMRALSLGLPTVLTTVIEGELVQPSRFAWLTGIHARRLALLRRATAIVAISGEIRNRLLEIGVPEEKIVELPVCGVDTEAFRPPGNECKIQLRKALGLSAAPMCLFAGTILERKRPHLLVPAMAELKRRGIEAQVVLAGPKHDEGYAIQMLHEAECLGVSDRVIWYGFTQKMDELMRAADVLALPSSDEGLPGVIMEAMASAVPCVYTDISGARDLIDDGLNGRIIAADGGGLGEALAHYLGHLEHAAEHGAQARQKAVNKFSNAAVFKKYLAVFDNVRNGRLPTAL